MSSSDLSNTLLTTTLPSIEELKQAPVEFILPFTLAMLRYAIKFTEEELMTDELHNRIDAAQRILFQSHSKHNIPLVTYIPPQTEEESKKTWRDKIPYAVKCLEYASQDKFHGIYGFQDAAILVTHYKWIKDKMKRMNISLL